MKWILSTALFFAWQPSSSFTFSDSSSTHPSGIHAYFVVSSYYYPCLNQHFCHPHLGTKWLQTEEMEVCMQMTKQVSLCGNQHLFHLRKLMQTYIVGPKWIFDYLMNIHNPEYSNTIFDIWIFVSRQVNFKKSKRWIGILKKYLNKIR